METPDPNPSQNLKARIERLDELIASREDGYRGLGVRLALGVAQEIQEGLALGSSTGEMVTRWVERFGAETVEEAVSHARVLLKDPTRMTEEFRKRLEPPEPVGGDRPEPSNPAPEAQADA